MIRKGFTLIELVVVVAVIGILAAIVTPSAFRVIEKAKISKAVADFKAIKAAANSLYADTGNWPHGGNSAVQVRNSDLVNNVSGWVGWNGPYLDNFRGATPWRGTYYFTTNAQLGLGPQYELSIEFEDYCFPSGPNGGCVMPTASARKIDNMVDDGNLGTGAFRGSGDFYWVLVWDLCPTSSCW